MGFDKTTFVATNALFFFALNLAKAGGDASLGLFCFEGLLDSAALLSFQLKGIGLGLTLHRVVSEAVFRRLINGLLAFAGLSLIVTRTFSLISPRP